MTGRGSFCHSLIAFLLLGFFLGTSLLIDLAKVDFAHQLDVSDVFLVGNEADVWFGFVIVVVFFRKMIEVKKKFILNDVDSNVISFSYSLIVRL